MEPCGHRPRPRPCSSATGTTRPRADGSSSSLKPPKPTAMGACLARRPTSGPQPAGCLEVVEEQLVDRRYPVTVRVGVPGELLNLAAGGQRPAVAAGVAAHAHYRCARVAAGLICLIGAQVPHRLRQQRDRQFLGDLAQQGLQVAFRAFALPAGDVEDVLPAWPGAQDPAVLQVHPCHRFDKDRHNLSPLPRNMARADLTGTGHGSRPRSGRRLALRAGAGGQARAVTGNSARNAGLALVCCVLIPIPDNVDDLH